MDIYEIKFKFMILLIITNQLRIYLSHLIFKFFLQKRKKMKQTIFT